MTDKPQFVRRPVSVLLGTALTTLCEAPYFSIPLVDEGAAIVDPDDAERELRPGEISIIAPIVISNASGTSRTVDLEIVAENGTVTTLARNLVVPGNNGLTLPPGAMLVKTDLAAPGAAGGRLRARASIGGSVSLTTTLVERELLQHAPDTED
ncbi:MAG: hypothetical protein ACK4OP_00175 [Gemmobacter sp.]